MKLLCSCFVMVMILAFATSLALAGREDCGNPPNMAKPVKEVKEENLNVQNDYDEAVKEDPNAIYLSLLNGDTPKANACGLNASNPAAEWTGWGGPIDLDNATIGEGAGARNEIVIGGTYFERGIGTHAAAKFVYDLTGAGYKRFECYVGMSDEKDPVECDHGGSSIFIFSIDGKEKFKSDLLKGSLAGENVDPVKVELEIPSGAKELVIQVTDGGDGNSCDHAALGDAKLFTTGMPVEPKDKAATVWGSIKSAY